MSQFFTLIIFAALTLAALIVLIRVFFEGLAFPLGDLTAAAVVFVQALLMDLDLILVS